MDWSAFFREPVSPVDSCDPDDDVSDVIFTTWKFDGSRFVAVQNGDGRVVIVDQTGNNYGIWQSVEAFRELHSIAQVTAIGRCTLVVHCFE